MQPGMLLLEARPWGLVLGLLVVAAVAVVTGAVALVASGRSGRSGDHVIRRRGRARPR